MGLIQSDDLQVGRLELISCTSDLTQSKCELVDTYRATSGLPGWQAPSDRHARAKGPIPNPEFTPARLPMFVSTKPLNYPNVKGIAGNFYSIDPDTIRTTVRSRSGFGLHADKNVPGTAGCVGLTDSLEWQNFQKQIGFLNQQGYQKIPLVVTYQTPDFP